ncbi:hypothetical protein V5799_033293 [Amblyomma americanum]|uniref:Uncharacterized protein n=1 Tax=Amblyomma americanum TaxID=6943 RepID=A0AAQ4DNR0_AMBAM
MRRLQSFLEILPLQSRRCARAQIFNVCTVIACVEDLFPQVRAHNNVSKVAFVVCIGMFVSGFPTVTQGGSYIVRLLEEQTVRGIFGHFIPLAEVVLVMYIYECDEILRCVDFLSSQFPLRAFQPEYLWEPNTVNRVNAYFEEIEDRDIGVGQESSGAEAPGILYDATEVLDISMDQDEPLAFRPFVG